MEREAAAILRGDFSWCSGRRGGPCFRGEDWVDPPEARRQPFVRRMFAVGTLRSAPVHLRTGPRIAKGIRWIGITSIAAAAGLSHPAEASVRVFATAPLRVVVPATLLLFLLLLDFAFMV
jgi:hypothetical protein